MAGRHFDLSSHEECIVEYMCVEASLKQSLHPDAELIKIF